MSAGESDDEGTSFKSSGLFVNTELDIKHSVTDSAIKSQDLLTFVDKHESDDEMCTDENADTFATDAYVMRGKHTRMNAARKKAGKRGVFEHHHNLHTVFDLALPAVRKKAAGILKPTAALAVYESKSGYDRKNANSGRSWVQQLTVLRPICARHKQGFIDLLGIVEVLITEHKLADPHAKIISVLLDLKRDFKAAVSCGFSDAKSKSSRTSSKQARSGVLEREMKKYEKIKKTEASEEKKTKHEQTKQRYVLFHVVFHKFLLKSPPR